MQAPAATLLLSRFAAPRIGPRIMMLAAALALSACSALGDKNVDITGDSVDEVNWAHSRAAELESEVVALKAENERLEKQLAELQQSAAQDEAAADASPVQPQAAAVKPETVIAAAEVGRALADAPAKPVQPSPRLVQPTFASGQETVFENEAASTMKMASVLYGVHLASYRTEETAKAGWRKLQRENPDELGLLEPRIERVTIENRGDFIRLIGGGFSSQEKALSLCAMLEAKGLYCGVTAFGGERLSLAENAN